MRQRQSGMTFLGFLCLLALVGLVLYGAIRLVPVYLNYMRIVHNMDQVATEFKGDNPDQGQIRISLERHWTTDYISDVLAKDIEIKKEKDGVTLHLAYDQSVGFIANVAFTVSFDKTVKIE
jgi:Domain of unknown function (DUF4845)